MPTPFAHPPTRKPPASAVACLSTVSVVMIARAKSDPPSGASAPVRIGSAARSGSTWIGSPITPVEHARTSAASTSSAAAAAEIDRPRVGVTPLAGRRVRLAAVDDHGPAVTVRDARAAQVDGGGGDTVRREQAGDGRAGIADEQPEVGAARRLQARAHAGRPEPPRVRHAHGYTPSGREPHGLVHAVHEVEVLDRLPRGALHEVVEGADHDRSARACVRHDLQLHHVRTARSLGVDHLAGRQHADERPSLVRLGQARRQGLGRRSGRERCVRGGDHAAHRRYQVRHEHDAGREPGRELEAALHLGRVLMPRHAVRANALLRRRVRGRVGGASVRRPRARSFRRRGSVRAPRGPRTTAATGRGSPAWGSTPGSRRAARRGAVRRTAPGGRRPPYPASRPRGARSRTSPDRPMRGAGNRRRGRSP